MQCRAMARSPEAERCCSSHSPTLRPWIAEMRRPTWRSFGARRSCVSVQCACKSRSLFSSEFCCAESAEGPFSLRRGLEFSLGISAEHHLSKLKFRAGDTKKATLSGRPRLKRLCGLNRVSSHTSQRGPGHQTALPVRGCARTRPARHKPVSRGSSWSCCTSCRIAP